MGQVEADTWGFLDGMTGDDDFYLVLGGGRGSPAYHGGVCLGRSSSTDLSGSKAVHTLLAAACGTDTEIDTAINAIPSMSTGPFPDVSGAEWWATLDATKKAKVRAWLRRKAFMSAT